MNTHNTPEYLVSTLECELEKLGVDRGFVKAVSIFNCHSKEDGSCVPFIEDGKMTGVAIDIKGEKSKRSSNGKIRHESKHAQQYFKKGRHEVEAINPVYYQIEASLYGLKRMMEEDLKTAYRKVKDLLRA
jgi:hypothetical protein